MQKSDTGTLRLLAWRGIEAQHKNSTRKLVDSVDDQILLEEILEQHKPPLPESAQGLHYLLATPFRYPPLRHGSRFGRTFERGIWYGAREQETCLAEVGFYRMLFLKGTDADLRLIETTLTVFRAGVDTPNGVDLTRRKFARDRHKIASRTSYGFAQALGTRMRELGVHAFIYPSARLEGGVCCGVFHPDAFRAESIGPEQTWHAAVSTDSVEFRRADYSSSRRYVFLRTHYEVEGELYLPEEVDASKKT